MGDSRRSVTDEEIVDLLKSDRRPVWTNSTIADELDITRQTANYRLKELEEKSDEIISIDVGQATAYYVPGIKPLPVTGNTKEYHRQSIIRWATDLFVGDRGEPWQIRTGEENLTAGDTVQIVVVGTPGNWEKSTIFSPLPGDQAREEPPSGAISEIRTQALVSGELYGKPTVPIEHVDYPDDWDLKGQLGTEYVGDPPNQPLLAGGPKRHLLRAANNAVHLKNPSVDWISVQGESPDDSLPTIESEEVLTHEEMEEAVEEWRSENLDESTEYEETDQ